MGSVIRLLAIVISGLVLLGFAFFAVDEMDRGSRAQQQALSELLGDRDPPTAIAPSSKQEAARELANGDFRELIDDANDVLLAPFSELIDSDSAWVNHGVAGLLALLLYGVGLGLVANMLPKARAHADDWRTAES